MVQGGGTSQTPATFLNWGDYSWECGEMKVISGYRAEHWRWESSTEITKDTCKKPYNLTQQWLLPDTKSPTKVRESHACSSH